MNCATAAPIPINYRSAYSFASAKPFKSVAKDVDRSLRKSGLQRTSCSAPNLVSRAKPLQLDEDLYDESKWHLPQLTNAWKSSSGSRQARGDRLAKSDRLRSQLEVLETEQNAKDEQLRAMRQIYNDCVELEEKARRRAAVSQQHVAQNKHRVESLDDQIKSVREDLANYERIRNSSTVVKGSRNSESLASASQASLDWTRIRSPDSSPRAKSAQQPMSKGSSMGQKSLADSSASKSGSGHGSPSHSEFGEMDLRSMEENFVPMKASEVLKLAAERARREIQGEHQHFQKSASEASPAAKAEARKQRMEEQRAALEEKERKAEECRENIRQAILSRVEDPREAFKQMDTNKNNILSAQEFMDGLALWDIDWMSLTDMRRPRNLFKLFEEAPDVERSSKASQVEGITFGKLFPAAVMTADDEPPQRVSTPDFWKMWCRKNNVDEFSHRQSKWDKNDKQLNVIFSKQQQQQDALNKRQWMSATFRRLKNRGKTDARCRECVALHLPRGTGPRDRDACPTFSDMEVVTCRKAYSEAVRAPTKVIQKVVYDMREQRRSLNTFRMQLYDVSMRQVVAARAEEERKQAVAGFASIGFRKPSKDDEKPRSPHERGTDFYLDTLEDYVEDGHVGPVIVDEAPPLVES